MLFGLVEQTCPCPQYHQVKINCTYFGYIINSKMQRLLEKDDDVKELNPLHGRRKTYEDEIKVNIYIFLIFTMKLYFAGYDDDKILC